jgi:hypothetical protein
MEIVQEIKGRVITGTVIPKPDAKKDFVVKGWGMRRKEEALIYRIPNHRNADKPHEKGISVGEWRRAYRRISGGEDFDKDWFSRNMPACAEEGDCNFTTIGGIFQLLGLVDYERGIYKSRIGSFK